MLMISIILFKLLKIDFYVTVYERVSCMKKQKKFEIRNGHIIYRDELEFKTRLHELLWKLNMKRKGLIVSEFIIK